MMPGAPVTASYPDCFTCCGGGNGGGSGGSGGSGSNGIILSGCCAGIGMPSTLYVTFSGLAGSSCGCYGTTFSVAVAWDGISAWRGLFTPCDGGVNQTQVTLECVGGGNFQLNVSENNPPAGPTFGAENEPSTSCSPLLILYPGPITGGNFPLGPFCGATNAMVSA